MSFSVSSSNQHVHVIQSHFLCRFSWKAAQHRPATDPHRPATDPRPPRCGAREDTQERGARRSGARGSPGGASSAGSPSPTRRRWREGAPPPAFPTGQPEPPAVTGPRGAKGRGRASAPPADGGGGGNGTHRAAAEVAAGPERRWPLGQLGAPPPVRKQPYRRSKAPPPPPGERPGPSRAAPSRQAARGGAEVCRGGPAGGAVTGEGRGLGVPGRGLRAVTGRPQTPSAGAGGGGRPAPRRDGGNDPPRARPASAGPPCQACSCQASSAPPVRPPPRPGERQGAELPRPLLSLPAGEPGCGPGEVFPGSPTLLLGFGRCGRLHLRLPWVKRALPSSSQKSTPALREEFLTLRGHPVAACSSEDTRPAQRDSDSAPKRLTLVGIASSSYGAEKATNRLHEG
ncbi:uncharacterized protein ACIBXB_010534 [Morphnus guianensis]